MILKKKSRVRGLTCLAVGTSHGNEDRGTGRRVDMYISGEDSGCRNKVTLCSTRDPRQINGERTDFLANNAGITGCPHAKG